MYPASIIIITAVALMVLFWAAFLVWAWRSGQFEDLQELRRLPLEDEPPAEQEGYEKRE